MKHSSNAQSMNFHVDDAVNFVFSSSFQLNDNGFEDGEDNYSKGNSGLKTLNLRLEEVAHIRSALTKAELEGIHDGNLRRDIKCGKVC